MNVPVRPALRVRVRKVPASSGLRWIRLGWRAFRRQPGGFLGLFALWLLTPILLALPTAVVVALVPALQRDPAILQLFGAVLLPLLSLGMMTGTEAVANDLPARPHMLFTPLGAGPAARRGILRIALAYFGALLLAYFAGNGLDGGEAQGWIGDRLMPKTLEALANPAPLGGMGSLVLTLKIGIVAAASAMLWHAPALVLWGGQGAAQALFSSVVGLWHSRAAFAVYLLGGTGVAVGFMIAVNLLLLLSQSLALGLIAALAGSWALCAFFYVTLWFGFVDTFEITRMPPVESVSRAE